MSGFAQNLSYLAIYNPTLRPTAPVGDDEDAEEQAHILFYTSKDRAASRDRMLRQVGLAKALVSFSAMFNADTPCTDVHSQTKRLVMVSPEPDFWIHAGIELARTTKTVPSNSKTKGKEKAKASEPTGYEYHEASVHDLALRADILRGYERFKLTHGSFTSILANLGQQALELQLERFFTVWAWSWHLEGGYDFGDHSGIPLHTLYRSISPVLDDLTSELSERAAALLITPSHVVPCSRFTKLQYPPALSRLLVPLLEPETPRSAPLAPDDTVKSKRPGEQGDNKAFLVMDRMVDAVDVRKWKWPGYLTFGKSPGKKQTADMAFEKPPGELPDDPAASKLEDVDYDKSALEDAMTSHTTPLPPPKEQDESSSIPESTSLSSISSETLPPVPIPHFQTNTVYLADPSNPLHTQRQKLYYLLHHPFVLILIGLGEGESTDSLAEKASPLFAQISNIIQTSTSVSDEIPSAAAILQTKERSIVSAEPYSISEERFSSTSVHLFNVKQLMERDSDFHEVFSRGQNPQDWHIGKRGLNIPDRANEGQLYLEVFRKEASLTEVDNFLAGLTRKITT